MKTKVLVFFIVIISCHSMVHSLDSTAYLIYSKVIYAFIKENRLSQGNQIFIEIKSDYQNAYAEFFKVDPYKTPCFACADFNKAESSYRPDYHFIDLWIQLDSINQQPVWFNNRFKIKKHKSILLDPTLKVEFITNYHMDWKQFYKTYPKSIGIITLSKIAHSKDGKYAMLYISYTYNGLGAVAKILLIDIEQDYQIIKEEVMWQS